MHAQVPLDFLYFNLGIYSGLATITTLEESSVDIFFKHIAILNIPALFTCVLFFIISYLHSTDVHLFYGDADHTLISFF
jgi:hypothetical protein